MACITQYVLAKLGGNFAMCQWGGQTISNTKCGMYHTHVGGTGENVENMCEKIYGGFYSRHVIFTFFLDLQ